MAAASSTSSGASWITQVGFHKGPGAQQTFWIHKGSFLG